MPATRAGIPKLSLCANIKSPTLQICLVADAAGEQIWESMGGNVGRFLGGHFPRKTAQRRKEKDRNAMESLGKNGQYGDIWGGSGRDGEYGKSVVSENIPRRMVL